MQTRTRAHTQVELLTGRLTNLPPFLLFAWMRAAAGVAMGALPHALEYPLGFVFDALDGDAYYAEKRHAAFAARHPGARVCFCRASCRGPPCVRQSHPQRHTARVHAMAVHMRALLCCCCAATTATTAPTTAAPPAAPAPTAATTTVM
jgi:hypothetical protein